MLRAIVILLALACSACASTSTASRNDARWQTYAQLTAASAEAQRQAEAEQSAQFDKVAAACPVGDAACVVAVAGFKALTMQRAGGQGSAGGIPSPPLERDFAAQARDLLTGVTPLAGTLANAAVSWRQSDNSRDVSIAQYGFLEGVVRSTGETAVAITQAGPRIEVGGNYGDTYGDDTTGGDRTDIGGDAIGGDRVSDSQVGDGNRVGSPDIDGSFNGGDCTSAPGGEGGTTGAGNTGTAPGGPSTGCQAGDGGG
jgi:hypothetical protein